MSDVAPQAPSSPLSYTMLGIPAKKATQLDLVGPIKKHVEDKYPPDVAREIVSDMSDIQALRDAVSDNKLALDDMRATLVKYYRALSAIEARFPISKDKEHISSIKFTWTDALRPHVTKAQQNIHFERAAVVFNLGCVLSQLAIQRDRKTDEGVRHACQLFQEAAGCFALVRDRLAARTEVPKPMDLSAEVLGFFEKMMLAQAQECFLERAAADPTKSPLLCARLANEASRLYQTALRLVNQLPDAASYVDKAWTVYGRLKELIMAAHTDLFGKKEDEKTTDIASMIPRLRHAYSMVPEIQRAARGAGAPPTVAQAAEALTKTIEDALREAETDNTSVYFRVPLQYAALPPLAPALVVKAAQPQALEVPPPDERWFASIVPDGHTRALSRYTDLSDSIVRDSLATLESCTDEDRLKLKEWELPECLEALGGATAAVLPDFLRSPLEQWDLGGGFRGLEETVAQLREMRVAALSDIASLEGQLTEEAAQDAAARQQWGGRWGAAPSGGLTGGMRQEAQKFRDTLAAAEKSDAQLAAKVEALRPRVATLSVRSASASLPKMAPPLVALSDADPHRAAAEVRRALIALDALSGERGEIEEDLRSARGGVGGGGEGEVLARLLAMGSDAEGAGGAGVEALFEECLGKRLRPLAEKAKAHAERHSAAIKDVGAWVAQYKEAWGWSQYRAAVTDAAKGLRETLDKVQEVRDNLEEGFRFYLSCQDRLRALRQRAADHCAARRIEREDAAAALRRGDAERRMAQMSLSAAPPPPQPMPMPPQMQMQMQHGAPPPQYGGPVVVGPPQGGGQGYYGQAVYGRGAQMAPQPAQGGSYYQIYDTPPAPPPQVIYAPHPGPPPPHGPQVIVSNPFHAGPGSQGSPQAPGYGSGQGSPAFNPMHRR